LQRGLSVGLFIYTVHLVTHENKIRGSIPVSIGNLTNLGKSVSRQYGNAYNKKGNIRFPESKDSQQSVQLRTHIFFALYYYAVTVCIETLTMDNNPITGTVPVELGNLHTLKTMRLHHTQLIGSMPKEVCSLKYMDGEELAGLEVVMADCGSDGQESSGTFHCTCCDRCY